MQEIKEMELGSNSKLNPYKHSNNLVKLVILIVILAVCISLLVLLNQKDSSIHSFIAGVKNRILDASSISISSIQFEPGMYPVFTPYADGLVCAKADGFKIYNIHGQEEWSESQVLSNPLVKADGRYMAIADIGGKNVYAYRNKNKIWTKSVDGEILNASINEKGYVVLVFKDSSRKSIVKVFDNNGTEILVRYYSNNYAIDAKVSPDCRIIAVGEVNASGFKTTCGVRFIPIGSKEDSGVFEEDSIIGSMDFMDKNLVIALNNKLLSISQDGTKTVLSDFGKSKVTNIDINRGKFIVKVQKANGFLNWSSNIDIINKNGKTIGSFELKDKVINIDARGDIISVNAGDKVVFLNSSGKQISQFSPKKDVKEVKLLRDGSAAGIVYVDSIEIVNIY